MLIISLKLYSQPQNINGLRLWLSADSNVVINNNKVFQWMDISGNGYVLSQIDSTKMPSYINFIDSMNNNPCIYFYDDF